jgi:hypothetical protein
MSRRTGLTATILCASLWYDGMRNTLRGVSNDSVIYIPKKKKFKPSKQRRKK